MKTLQWIVFICLCCLPFNMEAGLRILFIGDSITDGNWGNNNTGSPSSQRNLWDLNHIYGSGYMYLCATFFQSKFPENDYQFFNRGISGNKLEDLEKRWEEDVIQIKPDVLSILIGTNDVNWSLKNHKSFNLEQWELRYRALIDRSLRANPKLKIILCAPFTAKTGKLKSSEDYDIRKQMIEKCATSIRKIAKDYKAIFIPFNELFAFLQGKEVVSPESPYWIWDGIHPTPAGHAKMAEMWIKKTRKIFK